MLARRRGSTNTDDTRRKEEETGAMLIKTDKTRQRMMIVMMLFALTSIWYLFRVAAPTTPSSGPSVAPVTAFGESEDFAARERRRLELDAEEARQAEASAREEAERIRAKERLDAAKAESKAKEEQLDRERVAMQERLTSMTDDGIPVGYVRIPKIPRGIKNDDDGKLHIIFSSGCNYFQHWQAEFLLSTTKAVGQRGRITRIVSGCHDKSAEDVAHSSQTFPKGQLDLLVPLSKLNQSTNEDFGLYITPSFDGAKHFPWINKPASINYFMQHAAPELQRSGETVIVILDPDFVALQPITMSPLPASEVLNTQDQADFGQNVVRKGRPVAQRYGLGAGWMTRFPVEDIVGEGSPALDYTASRAAKYFAVGPPLMLHVDDLTELAVLWEANMYEVLKVETDILADMWAYCMAAAHLQLEHTLLDQYMLSTWGGPIGQAWPWTDIWPEMSCLNPQTPAGHRGPNYIHMASNFKAPKSKEWMFHKGHVHGDILECDAPLIVDAPDALWFVSEDVLTKQSAWILCHIVERLNKVALEYKQKFCPPGYETRKLVRLIQSKTKDRRCNEKTDKWCYPLAQIEGITDEELQAIRAEHTEKQAESLRAQKAAESVHAEQTQAESLRIERMQKQAER